MALSPEPLNALAPFRSAALGPATPNFRSWEQVQWRKLLRIASSAQQAEALSLRPRRRSRCRYWKSYSPSWCAGAPRATDRSNVLCMVRVFAPPEQLGSVVWVLGEPCHNDADTLRRAAPSAPHVAGRLVLAQPDETGVTQVAIGRPLDELELAYQHRLQPPALCHLLRG